MEQKTCWNVRRVIVVFSDNCKYAAEFLIMAAGMQGRELM